jgi:hypothetical protein
MVAYDTIPLMPEGSGGGSMFVGSKEKRERQDGEIKTVSAIIMGGGGGGEGG